MAISIAPKDLLTKSQVEAALSGINLCTINTPSSKFSNTLKDTSDLVEKILKKMGLQGSTIQEMMEDFENKINSIASLTSVLNDKEYLSSMVNTYKIQMPEWKKDYDEISEIIREQAPELYQNFWEDEFSDTFTTKDVSDFLRVLIEDSIKAAGKNGILMNTTGILNGVSLQFNRLDIRKDVVGEGASFKEALHKYLEHVFKNDLKIAAKLQNFVNAASNHEKTLYIEKTLSDDSIDYQFWYDSTQGQRHSDISIKKYESDPEVRKEVNQVNANFTSTLLNSIITNAKNINPNILNSFIDKYHAAMEKLFSSDPLILYIGRNTNNIIGILGELEAGIILEIFNGGVSPEAVGALRNSQGKQLGADWWVHYGDSLIAGIQVKNSSLGNQDIGFQQISLEQIKASLAAEYSQIFDAVENLFFIRHFNYQFNKDSSGQLVRMANEKFAPVDEIINRKLAQVNAALSSVVANWLHIQTEEYSTKLKGRELGRNVLYVVNGLWYTATDMLLKVQDQIQTNGATTAFHIKMEEETYQGTKGTILDWIIHNGRGSSYTGDINDPTDFVAQFAKVKYTSAFNFGEMNSEI